MSNGRCERAYKFANFCWDNEHYKQIWARFVNWVMMMTLKTSSLSKDRLSNGMFYYRFGHCKQLFLVKASYHGGHTVGAAYKGLCFSFFYNLYCICQYFNKQTCPQRKKADLGLWKIIFKDWDLIETRHFPAKRSKLRARGIWRPEGTGSQSLCWTNNSIADRYAEFFHSEIHDRWHRYIWNSINV